MYRLLTSLYATFCISCLATCSANAQTPVGQWQDHLSWRPAVAVAANGNKIYCGTAQGLYSATTGDEQELSRYSKINGDRKSVV